MVMMMRTPAHMEKVALRVMEMNNANFNLVTGNDYNRQWWQL
jgi:hypothetical protein